MCVALHFCLTAEQVVVQPHEDVQIIYLWKKLVLFGDLIKHFVSLDSWFQVSSQYLRGE